MIRRQICTSAMHVSRSSRVRSAGLAPREHAVSRRDDCPEVVEVRRHPTPGRTARLYPLRRRVLDGGVDGTGKARVAVQGGQGAARNARASVRLARSATARQRRLRRPAFLFSSLSALPRSLLSLPIPPSRRCRAARLLRNADPRPAQGQL
jgi:hypothetical protein